MVSPRTQLQRERRNPERRWSQDLALHADKSCKSCKLIRHDDCHVDGECLAVRFGFGFDTWRRFALRGSLPEVVSQDLAQMPLKKFFGVAFVKNLACLEFPFCIDLVCFRLAESSRGQPAHTKLGTFDDIHFENNA